MPPDERCRTEAGAAPDSLAFAGLRRKRPGPRSGLAGQRLYAPEAGRVAKLGNNSSPWSVQADALDGGQQFTHLVMFEPPRDRIRV